MHTVFVAADGTGPRFGLYRFQLGEHGWVGSQFDAIDRLSALAPHPSRSVLYGVSGGPTVGVLHWWNLRDSPEHTSLRFESGGIDPSHVTVDPNGRFLVVTNYGSGTLGFWRLNAVGKPEGFVDIVELGGSSVDPERQTMSHPHQSQLIRGRLFVSDLGADLIREFRVPAGPADAIRAVRSMVTPPGTGPRHMVPLPGARLFVSGELSSTAVIVSRGGAPNEVSDSGPVCYSMSGAATTLLSKSSVRNFPGDVRSSRSGEFGYIANRGADSVSTMRVSGPVPEMVGELQTEAAWPQHMELLENELLVACRDASVVISFPLMDEVPTRRRILFECPNPAWLTVFPAHLRA